MNEDHDPPLRGAHSERPSGNRGPFAVDSLSYIGKNEGAAAAWKADTQP